VPSDNGSEFKAAFDAEVTQDGVGRWLTYPKAPKMNALVERFNSSIQVEFIAYYKDLLFTDVNLFNDKLLDYLVWFNTERPHYGLGLIVP
jgi:transposase InsO family protein